MRYPRYVPPIVVPPMRHYEMYGEWRGLVFPGDTEQEVADFILRHGYPIERPVRVRYSTTDAMVGWVGSGVVFGREHPEDSMNRILAEHEARAAGKKVVVRE